MLQPSAYNEVNMVFGEKRKTNYYYIPYCVLRCARAKRKLIVIKDIVGPILCVRACVYV